MRCNLFRPLGSGDAHVGEFLMFSQYTEDITKEQSMKSGYRVIPSKFVALNLDIKSVFNGTDSISADSRPVSAPIRKDNTTGEYYMIVGVDSNDGNIRVEGCNNIISQIFQSYFENANAYIRNHADETGFPEWNQENRSLASELLWRMLDDWGFIHKVSNDDTVGFDYYDEVKYIGDINIHSNHKVGSYGYDEVFCHIPAKEDEYYYHLNESEIEGAPSYEDTGGAVGDLNSVLEGWTDISYPTNNTVRNRAITYHEPNDNLGHYYRFGGDSPVLDFKGNPDYTPVPRHIEPHNDEYNFNAVMVFYDVLCSEPGEDPVYLYKDRPMGIYLTGGVEEGATGLANTFTKFISNNDAYGQGASFGLRIMMRYTPTPNNSTYAMEVATGGHDYETITEAMGCISDTISDINRMCKDQHAMYQAYKDHLAQFRNRMINVPYIRDVAGVPYWFINGRNTGQPVYPAGYEPRVEYTDADIINSISITPQGSASVTIVTPDE